MAEDNVLVACRLPAGLHLDIGDGEARVRHTLRGASQSRIIGAPACTPVPRAHWEQWVAKNGKLTFMRNGMVFAVKSESEAEHEASRGGPTGFEGADPAKPAAALEALR